MSDGEKMTSKEKLFEFICGLTELECDTIISALKKEQA